MGSVFIQQTGHRRGGHVVKQIIQCLALILFLGVVVSGCSYGIFNTEPFVDSHRDENGNVILEDTPRMWKEFVDSVEPRIAKEIAGRTPEAGSENWNDYWTWSIQILPTHMENRKKYVNYIVDRRRQEGLPELVNQAEQK